VVSERRFFLKRKAAYALATWLVFRRVLFRSVRRLPFASPDRARRCRRARSGDAQGSRRTGRAVLGAHRRDRDRQDHGPGLRNGTDRKSVVEAEGGGRGGRTRRERA